MCSSAITLELAFKGFTQKIFSKSDRLLANATAQTADPVDSIVQITAENFNLTPISQSDMPRFCTVWIVEPGFGGAVPMPCLPATPAPLYQLADGSVLADGTINQTLPGDAAKVQAMLAAEAAAVVQLVNQTQAG